MPRHKRKSRHLRQRQQTRETTSIAMNENVLEPTIPKDLDEQALHQEEVESVQGDVEDEGKEADELPIDASRQTITYPYEDPDIVRDYLQSTYLDATDIVAEAVSGLDYTEIVADAMRTLKRSHAEASDQSKEISLSKKRRPLQPIDGSSSRLNVQGVAAEDDTSKSRNEQLAVATAASDPALLNMQPSARTLSRASSARANGIHRKNWPRLQDSTNFHKATINEQRTEITNYMENLLEYTKMIQAGAIPKGFVETFFRRLETHFLKLDGALDQIEMLHRREGLRKVQLRVLLQEGEEDHEEVQSLLTEFELPSSRDVEG